MGRDYIETGKYTDFIFPSLGYRKSEADKHILEIDPVTAPVVRYIFDLRLQGNGFRKIALRLNAEKVPAPRTFYYMAEGRENFRGETPYWNDVTVKTILRNQVYIGHMVQNKTGMERTKALQAEVNAISKRLPELDRLIMSAYEDKVLGRVPESVS